MQQTSRLATIALAAAILPLAVGAHHADEKKREIMVMPGDIKWQDGPPSLPKGAQMAVLEGDPSKRGPFVMRAKLPDGYKIAPHTHPTDEHITIIKGTFLVGMGNKLDAKNVMTFETGGFGTAPANMAHYAIAKGRTIVQVHAIGPFALTYVNPADDPTKTVSAKKKPKSVKKIIGCSIQVSAVDVFPTQGSTINREPIDATH